MNISNREPKISLITDTDNWAFANIANQIKIHLSDYYDIKTVSFVADCQKDINILKRKIQDCDIVHFFMRDLLPHVIPIQSEIVSNGKFNNQILSTCVYSHSFLNKKEIKQRTNLFNKVNYYVCSERLREIYQNIEGYKNPIMVIEDGVDPNLFYPINLERLKKDKDELIIGWVGNSKWGSHKGDIKGLDTLVKPVIDELANSGHQIKGLYCDRNEKFIPHNEMVYYYSKMDVLVCMSKIEGTPNPILEAMACGVPVVTTDVGIVPQLFGPKQKEFILKKRDKISLKQELIKLYNDRSFLWELSQENLEQVTNWHWSQQCLKFKSYFDSLLNEYSTI